MNMIISVILHDVLTSCWLHSSLMIDLDYIIISNDNDDDLQFSYCFNALKSIDNLMELNVNHYKSAST